MGPGFADTSEPARRTAVIIDPLCCKRRPHTPHGGVLAPRGIPNQCSEGRGQVEGTGLTPREREILELLAEDNTLHAIAERLYVSYTTVRNHVQHILLKLGVHSTMEAVAQHLLESNQRQKR